MYRSGALSFEDADGYSSLSDSDSEIVQLESLSLEEPAYEEVISAAWEACQL